MTDVSRILAERIDVELDASDFEPPQATPEPVPVDEIISRLRDVGAFVAEADADPPTRLRHCFAIDLAIAKLRHG